MEARYCILGVAVCLLAVHTVSATEWTYEFGPNKDIGSVFYDQGGRLWPFMYRNYITIPVPSYMEVTYVEVKVNTASPPKVDFDEKTNTVSIIFSIFHIPLGSYHIQAKGLPAPPPTPPAQ